MELSGGRASRRNQLPGMRPAPYRRSSKSTLRGKKSIPSRALLLIVAVASNNESPSRIVAEPPACLANRPVSIVMVESPICAVYVLASAVFTSAIGFVSLLGDGKQTFPV